MTSATQDVAAMLASEALVMMVDDEELVIDVTRAFLESAGYTRFVFCSDSPKAIEVMQRERPHVLLLDINMPRVNGLQILERMRFDPQLRHIPTIVLTSADDADTKLAALELGAMDFLRKPVDASELVLRLRNTLAAKAYQDYLAHYDRPTGLANRQRFMEQLELGIGDARARSDIGALLQLNLDRFKQINEALGPAIGDGVIKAAARRVSGALEMAARPPCGIERSFSARVAGDEFSIMLASIQSVEQVSRVAEMLRTELGMPYQIQGRDLHVTASIGIALFPTDGDDIDELVKNCASALRQAKQAGRNAFRFYSKEFNDKAHQRLALETQLRKAVERGEFELFFQPKFNIARHEPSGAEALLRWRHPERGLVTPSEFIPVAEDSGLIVPIGVFALKTACQQLAEWAQAGLRRLPVAVNVSPRQFDPQLVQFVREAVQSTGQADYLRLELTESSVMSEPQSAIRLLAELKRLGTKLSIEDFGTGYSSLGYLQKLPLDELKIDRSFLSAIRPGGADAVLVDVIIAMAHGLGLTVVAEGVENELQLDYLRSRRCDECQGYFFSQPLPAREFAAKFLKPA